jgi:uncharacterized membrane protein
MKFDNIFIPKGNGLGWTLNFSNPLSFVVLLIVLAFIYYVAKPQIKEFISITRGYFKK